MGEDIMAADHQMALLTEYARATGKHLVCDECAPGVLDGLSRHTAVWFQHEVCADSYRKFRDKFISNHSAWT